MSTLLPPLTANFGGTPTDRTSLGVSSTSATTSTTTSPRQQQQPPQSQQSPAFGASSPPPTFGSGGGMISNPLLAAARSGVGGPTTSPGAGLSGYRRTYSGGEMGNTAGSNTIGANPLLGMGGPSVHHPSASSFGTQTMGLTNRFPSSDNNNNSNNDPDPSFGIRRRRPVVGGGGEENDDPNVTNVPPPPPKISLGMISSGRYSGEYGGGVASVKRGGAFDSRMRELPTDKVKKPSELSNPPQTTSTKIQSALTTTTTTTTPQNEYSTWVVIYGFTSPTQHRTILHRFETYGTIVQTHYLSDDVSNFVCVRYESFLQAEKALCQHGTFLECGDGGKKKGGVVIIGVSRVDRSMARKLGLSYGGDGSITVTERGSVASEGKEGGWRVSSPGGAGGAGGGERSGKNSFLLNENDILLFGEKEEAEYYRRRGNVCDRFMAWLVGARERLDGY